MRTAAAAALLGAVAGALVAWAILRGHGPEAEEEAAPAGAQIRVLELDARALSRAGIRVAPLEAASLAPEVRAYGQVLDPTPLADLVFGLASAQAELDASGRELARVRGLHRKDENASARELEAAELAFRRDRSTQENARARLLAAFGPALAGRADLPELVQRLAAGEAALARLDVPLGEGPSSAPGGVRLAALEGEDAPREALLLGAAPNVEQALPGRGFLCLLEGGAPPSGTPLVGWLAAPGPPQTGVLIPREALVRHAGQTFVYVERSEGAFERRLSVPESPLPEGWFVALGFTAGERVVVVGAQQLLSEELRAEIGEE